MTRYLIAATILTAVGIAVVAGVAVAVVCRCFARGEAADEHDCGGTCPAHDVGPDDLEAVARVTGLVVFNAPTLLEALVEQAVEGESCPDYPHEIVWSKS